MTLSRVEATIVLTVDSKYVSGMKQRLVDGFMHANKLVAGGVIVEKESVHAEQIFQSNDNAAEQSEADGDEVADATAIDLNGHEGARVSAGEDAGEEEIGIDSESERAAPAERTVNEPEPEPRSLRRPKRPYKRRAK